MGQCEHPTPPPRSRSGPSRRRDALIPRESPGSSRRKPNPAAYCRGGFLIWTVLQSCFGDDVCLHTWELLTDTRSNGGCHQRGVEGERKRCCQAEIKCVFGVRLTSAPSFQFVVKPLCSRCGRAISRGAVETRTRPGGLGVSHAAGRQKASVQVPATGALTAVKKGDHAASIISVSDSE